jgi:hypothetical protein
MEQSPEVTERTLRPILATMRERSNKDWGEYPKYNEDYRKLRWPGKPWVVSEMIHPINNGVNDMVYNRLPDLRGDPLIRIDTNSLFGPGRRVPEKPTWMIDFAYRNGLKRRGRWNSFRPHGGNRQKLDTIHFLKIDLRNCMALNIPFRTNTLEYRPSTQWIYIKGTPVVKYELETGKIMGFSYSGVYDKVITFMLRHIFQLNIKLVRRKLIWGVNPRSAYFSSRIGRALLEGVLPETQIDLNTFYHFEDMRSPNRVIMSDELYRERSIYLRGLLNNPDLPEDNPLREVTPGQSIGNLLRNPPRETVNILQEGLARTPRWDVPPLTPIRRS